jgi:hypothetical protein
MAIPSLAEEIRAYITSGALPPPRPGQEESLLNALERWAKRAAALAQIRDELLREVADLRSQVEALEVINGMRHVPSPRTWVATEQLRKLEAVAEAAREVLQIAVDKLRNRDGLLQLESWVLVPKELICKLASALDAIEKVK